MCMMVTQHTDNEEHTMQTTTPAIEGGEHALALATLNRKHRS